MKISIALLLKIGLPVITILFAGNLYFIKGMADYVGQIPSLREQVRAIDSQMPNVTQLRIDVSVLQNTVSQLRDDIKKGRL